MHRSRLPVLHPCDQDWARMAGSELRRHCAACDREVLNLSAMRAEAAIDALIARDGKACIRYRTDAAGEIQFAPPPPRRPGPIATAALALSACAGWAEDPVAVPPGELGMCVADDDADACDVPEPPRPAEAVADEAPAEPEPQPPATDRDFTAVLEVEPSVTGDSAGVPVAELQRIKVMMSEADPDRSHHEIVGVLVIRKSDPTKSLFDRESTAGPGRDWWTTVELLRRKRQLRVEERQRRRAARRR